MTSDPFALPEGGLASPTLLGAAAFASVDELAAMSARGARGADALIAVALAPWLPAASRVAAVEALDAAEVTASTHAGLTTLSEGARKPPYAQAVKALAGQAQRATPEALELSERCRTAARHVREGVRGTLRRQQHQRDIAEGHLPPAVGLMVGDDGDFVAGLLPPIADGARDPLVPVLLAVLRGPSEGARQRVFALMQRRWREVAAPSLGAVLRSSLRGRDAGLAAPIAKALAAMGAYDELALAVGAVAGSPRAHCLAELSKAGDRPLAELDPALLEEALGRASGDADPALGQRAAALLAALRSAR